MENTTLSTIGFFYYCRQGGIFQYHPVDNSKKKFPIVDRVVLDNTDPLIKGKKYFGILILKNDFSLFSPNYNANTVSMARRYCLIPSSSFEVEAIPPPPSALPPEVGSIASTSQDSEDIFQYLLAMLMPLSHRNKTKRRLRLKYLQCKEGS